MRQAVADDRISQTALPTRMITIDSPPRALATELGKTLYSKRKRIGVACLMTIHSVTLLRYLKLQVHMTSHVHTSGKSSSTLDDAILAA
jgi:hypothetical protein